MELADFIEQERALGGEVSAGKFSISAERARIALQRFQLPRPEYWLLKVVQAALGGGAESVDIRITARVVEINFQPSEEPDIDTVAERIRNPQEGSGWLADFAVGLNAATGTDYRSLLIQGGKLERWGLKVVSDRVELFPKGLPGKGWSIALCRRFSLWRLLFRGRGDLHRLVYQHCRFSPLEVRLDGRPIERGSFEQDWINHPWGYPAKDYTRLFYLVYTHLGQNRGLARQVPVFPGGLADVLRCQTLAFRARDHSLEGAVAIPLALRGRSYLHVVRGGVLIASLEINTRFQGVQAAVVADHLKVDATQFQLVEDQQFREMVEAIVVVADELGGWGVEFIDQLPDEGIRAYVQRRLGF